MNNQRKNAPVIGPGGRPGGGPAGSRMKVEKPKNLKVTLGRLLGYIGKNKLILITMLVMTLVVTVIDLLGPWLQGEAINTIKYDEITKEFSVDMVHLSILLGVMGGIFVISAMLSYFNERIAARLSQETVYALRKDLFKKISSLPISYTDTHRHGDIMSRMTNDVENVSNAVAQSVSSLFSSAVTLLGAVILMLMISPLMTAIAFVTIPITIAVSSVLAKFMRKHYKEQQRRLGELNGHIEEMVTGYKTVMSYGMESEQCEHFDKISRELKRCSVKARVWGGVMGPCMNIIGNLQYLLIAAVGGHMAFSKMLSIGDIQKMLGYSKKFTRPVNEIANQYSSILTAIAGAERIFEIMDNAEEINEGTVSITNNETQGRIEFKNVFFSYVPEEPVLKNLNLTVEPGQKIAIVGATGSGKTTIVNLLMRFYETNSGSILIDGIDIKEITKQSLRRSIAIVLQDTVLFSDSIKSNIKYGSLDSSDEQMEKAAKMANADTFITRLPEGYETELAESGSNLSQGQRQLLSIARAVLADSKILILDEATSSVDTRTEMNIQSAMVALMKNRTSLIIAHRLSTIRDADKIVVLAAGEIVEIGSHEELIEKRGEYYKLYSSQFAGVAI